MGQEVEVDAICDGEQVLIPGIMEHIERAGVHSGDSFAVYPGINLFPAEVETIVDYTTRIALGFNARGLINIQYVIHAGRIYVLEVNPRASRTVPFLSKATGVPMVRLATGVMLGRTLAEQGFSGGLWPQTTAGGGQGAGLLDGEAARRRQSSRPGDEVHGRGHGHRPIV